MTPSKLFFLMWTVVFVLSVFADLGKIGVAVSSVCMNIWAAVFLLEGKGRENA